MNKAIEFLKTNLNKACLDSFGVKKQFIELGFSSSEYELIEFFIDCEIATDNQEFTEKASLFKDANKDVYEIIYFVPANLEIVSSITFSRANDLCITFSNGYTIVFALKSDYGNPLSVTFKKKSNDRKYIAIDFRDSEEVYIKEVDLAQ